MAQVKDLKNAISESLERKGVLNQVKAQIRAEMFHVLDEHSEGKPPICNENLIINELILEYLQYNKYKHTSSVLMAEAGQSETRLDREFIKNELNIAEDLETSSVPLLYSLVNFFLQQNAGSKTKVTKKETWQ
ncbi:20 isoform X2 [Octopus vulgaris]|uniref:Centrosomal protein 20 n=1 Tax=Octopus vulgaris TaxID=6645 RepID=A0AA36F8I0_OCTVU|nr:20 isoform X2 [Octopus vulgaris]